MTELDPRGHVGLGSSDRRLSTHDQIARALGMDILSGRYPPDMALPGEAELLARFQVSRTVLREVIKTLAAKGFLVSKTRVGTKVLPAAHWSFFDPDVLSWKLAVGYDAAFRDDVAEIRRAIEPRAAALAASRHTPEDLQSLRHWIERMRQSGHSAREFAEADLGLHLAVGVASRNMLMRSIGSIIEAALVASFTLASPVDEVEVLAESLDLHEAIVDAIAARDADRAAAAMLVVINHGDRRIAKATDEGAVSFLSLDRPGPASV